MDCILLVAKSWSQPTLACYWLDIHENTFRNVVCEIETILYWSQYIRIQPHIFLVIIDVFAVPLSVQVSGMSLLYPTMIDFNYILLSVYCWWYQDIIPWNEMIFIWKKKIVKLCSICSCSDNLQLLYIVAGRCICEIGHYHDCWCCGYQ